MHWLRAVAPGPVAHAGHLTLDRLLSAEAFVLVAALALVAPAQADTWWQLAAGREMAATGHVLRTETWSHTASGLPWFNHQWGSEIFAYLLVRWGGLPLLAIAGAALIVAATATAWSMARGPLAARALLLILFTIDATATWALRAQLVTLVLVPLSVRLVLDRRWWWLPPIFAGWANLHGGVALGCIVLAIACLVALVLDRRLALPAAATGLACVLAVIATPYGMGYWSAMAASVGRITANPPVDWQPPDLAGPHLVFWITVAALPVAIAIGWRRLRSFDTALLAAAASAFGVIAASGQRHVAIFLALALPAVTRLLWDEAPDRAVGAVEPRVSAGRSRVHALVLAASLVAASMLVGSAWRREPWAYGRDPMSPAAVAAVQACRPPIYNTYNEGGYLVWFVPGQPVFVDSRQDPYPVALVRAHIDAERHQDYGPLFGRHGISCAVFRAGSNGPGTLRRLGWRERYRDARWVVLDPPQVRVPR